MKRGGLAMLVLGLGALPAGAGDYETYMKSLRETPVPPFPVAHQPACAPQGGCDTGRGKRSGDRLQRLIEYFTFRPTPGCDPCRPTSYTPPLTAWFRCRENPCNLNPCPTGGCVGGKCGTGCGTAVPPAPVLVPPPAAPAPAPLPVQPVPGPAVLVPPATATAPAAHLSTPRPVDSYWRSPTEPVAKANVPVAKPSIPTPNPIAPVAKQNMQFTKPQNSTQVQPTGHAAPAGLPGGYRVAPSSYYIPKN